MAKLPIIIGITGASGSVIAKKTIEELLARELPVIATCSSAARMVWQEEMDEPFHETLAQWRRKEGFTYFQIGDIKAPIASGTFPSAGMAIVPCSMNTMASIAHGLSQNLVHRAAEVCLKEKRRLVLVPRETPLSAIQLENMLTLARLGATVLTPEPAFYLHPRTVDDIVDFVVARTLLALGVIDAMPEALQYKRRSE